jgi:hypothetical protein
MNSVVLLLILAIVAALLWWWLRRRKRPGASGEIDASASTVELAPTAVTLPEESGLEERGKRRRTGETQALHRKVTHGQYRPVDDRGEPSGVRTQEEK